MASKFVPNKGQYLVRRDHVEEMTAGGLYKPQQAQDKPQTGTIVSSHPENTYKVNDRPVFGRYAGTEIDLLGETLLILTDEYILGVMVEETV